MASRDLSGLFGQIPEGDGAGSKMTWWLALKSEAEIGQIATAQIVPTKEAAAVLGGSGNCRLLHSQPLDLVSH
ncbi:hypothetical protein FVA81_19685 [Rhizobium sp. WL3]|uniref:hypothetical protein n=1 Tax=Rhizobium sp. WL3 TaxID=2603277 RepID=UPI0011C1D807|nr:hypothetical protein [Rhizobium sp. WL3]QEE46688.1 hypothetical protein FVA81_19685 [Rhizobium sp. WL3]